MKAPIRSTRSIISTKFLLGIATASLLAALPSARAQTTSTWDGGGTNGRWTNATNWNADTLPVANNVLTFGGTNRTTTTNDFSAGTQFNGFNFTNATAGQNFTLSGSNITLGGDIVTTATNTGSGGITATISLPLTLDSTRTVNTGQGHNVSISGLIDGAGGLTKSGAGAFTLNNTNNSFSGVVTLSGGTLSANSIGNGVNSAIGNSTNAIQYAGGSITYTGGTATISRAFTFTTNANGSFQNDSAGYVTYNGTLTGTNANFTLNGGSAGIGGTNDWQSDFGNGNNTPTVVVKGGSGNWFISGAIKTGTAGVSVGGTGTLTLNNNSNNFSGAMNVIGGATLNFTTITNVGAGASSVGAPTNNANGLFTLGSTADGTLNYIGTGSSTDRRIKIGNVTNAIGNARINNNGSGALVWTDPAFMNTQSNYTVNHTLTLGGTNTNANEIKGAILDQAAISTTSLIKADSGRWILSGTNTYTGATTVSAGTLQINGSVASSAITVSNAAVLGGTGSAGTVTVNGTFAPGAPATNGTFTVTSALSVPGTAQFRVFGNGINDQVIASGGASLSGTVSVLIDTNYAPASGDSYDFVTGVISNTPTLSLPALGGGLTWVTNTFLSTGVLSITNGGATPYDTWVAYWQTNSSGFTNTAGTDNPDGDPFDNNEEFAFDGNPTVGTGALLTAVRVGTNAVFNYVAMTNTNAVTYQVQVTGNLTNGWTNASVTISNSLNQTNPVISQTNLYERKEFIVPATASQFYRVQATIVP